MTVCASKASGYKSLLVLKRPPGVVDELEQVEVCGASAGGGLYGGIMLITSQTCSESQQMS